MMRYYLVIPSGEPYYLPASNTFGRISQGGLIHDNKRDMKTLKKMVNETSPYNAKITYSHLTHQGPNFLQRMKQRINRKHYLARTGWPLTCKCGKPWMEMVEVDPVFHPRWVRKFCGQNEI